MKIQRFKTAFIIRLSLLALAFGAAATVAFAQSRPAGNRTNQPQPTNQANTDAEREKIWNSPSMLRARAWLMDHISKSAKITPEEGQQYMNELENMSPTQMKLWLLKFDHEEDMRQQQYTFWQQGQQTLASRAMASNRATQQAYNNINQAETAAAQQEQGQLNVQAAERAERSEDNSYAPLGPYAPYGYGYPGYGGVHFHYHAYGY